MKKICGLLLGLSLGFVSAHAESAASEFSLFKRITGPSMSWGENGLMMVPKAQPIGKGNINLGTTAVDSGQIQGDKLYLTTATLMMGTSEDVELGFSKRTFIWETGERSDVEMDSFHLKARVFNLTDYYTPQISVGVNGSSLKGSLADADGNADVLYNPYVAVTIPIKVFTENFKVSLTGVAEKIYNEGESSEAIYSAGADMVLFNTVYLMAEAQGIGQEEEDPVVNVGAKLTVGWFSIGAGLFNIQQDKIQSGDVGAEENKEQYYMAHFNVKIPLLKVFGGESKSVPPSEDNEEEKKEETTEKTEVQPEVRGPGKVYMLPEDGM